MSAQPKAKKSPPRAASRKTDTPAPASAATYGHLLGNIDTLLATARQHTARAVNACMTATYWHVGRYIVEFEQGGAEKAEYGDALLEMLAADLTTKHGRGFSQRNLFYCRQFYTIFDSEWVYKATTCNVSNPILQTLSAKSFVDPQQLTNPPNIDGAQLIVAKHDKDTASICQTLSGKSFVDSQQLTNPSNTTDAQLIVGKHDKDTASICSTVSSKSPAPIFQTLSGKSTIPDLPTLAKAFPLPWSHYVMLISRSRSPEAREFYHAEALRGGWSVRQLDRQISTLFYERAALSKNKAAILQKGERPRPGETLTPDEEIRDPLVLEFLNLRDEYSESELEDALIRHLETFLLELGNDFTFVGRQRRLRLDNEWYRVDLLFFHRRLRSLVVIDLKLGKFTHADAGQMNLYLNYARAHWTHPDENPPIGLILCSEKSETIARYALDGLENKIQAREYKHTLPAENLLAAELAKTAKRLAQRKIENKKTPPANPHPHQPLRSRRRTENTLSRPRSIRSVRSDRSVKSDRSYNQPS
ncbi:MAG: PDDEXK nuclease domain-containing protein [Opitutaceae bacterium]|jgi:predicted nuclease of restriction endonuclease-like (RecB) superfamily|nr:PDDEXK nuclease domain-containing protein [Opitutaceae bacterium]